MAADIPSMSRAPATRRRAWAAEPKRRACSPHRFAILCRRVGKGALAPCPPSFTQMLNGGHVEPVIGRRFAPTRWLFPPYIPLLLRNLLPPPPRHRIGG